MSVGALQFFPVALPTAPANTTSPFAPVAWGREQWVPPGDPPPPPAVTSPPEGRRRRRRRRRRREPAPAPAWGVGEGGDRRAWAPWPWDLALNVSGPIDALNLTAEDVDYIWNISQKKRWGAGEGVGANGYPIHLGHRRNHTGIQPRPKMNGDDSSNISCYCENPRSLLLRMVSSYQSLHPVAALTVCALGTLANALNVAVLTRPHLAPAPVNRILTAIAAADAALMAEYASYVIFVRLPQASKSGSGGGRDAAGSPPLTPAEEAAMVERKFPFAGAAFVLFHTHFSQVMHTVSICLTLTLAVWRYLALRLPPERARILCSRRRCSVALAISVLLPPLLCTPSYILFGIVAREITIEPHAHHQYHHQVAATTAAHGAPSLPPDQYTIEPSLLIPTAAVSSLDADYGPGPASTLPSVSAALRQMAWAAAPEMEPAAEVEAEGDWEDEWRTAEDAVTTTTPEPWSPHLAASSPTRLPEVPPTVIAVAYVVELSKVARDKGEMLYIVNFWVYAVMLKLLPCLVLTVISVCLVRTLCRAKSRRRALQGDVKKAPAPKSFPLCRWRKKDKAAQSKSNAAPSRSSGQPSATPQFPPPQRERPLDDGGVWMGQEETRPPAEVEEEEEEGVEEEEGATLVQEPSSRGEGDGPRGNGAPAAAADGGGGRGGQQQQRREWLPGWLTLRRRRRGTAADGAVGGGAKQDAAVATVGAAVRRRRRRTERTTRMLVAVLILFLVTEFPQGVLGLMSGLLGRCFFQTCYHLFGDLMDLLALLNGSINFILYCAMSRQFRQTFAQLFCKHPKLLWMSLCKSCPSSGHENGIEIMKNGNMGGEGLRKGATTVGGQPSQSMGDAQSTYV
ncbi:uncharacterized protein LOC124166836 [Ischnura elegans]|uniref:uncharacterized protein LOC124166836 n=1 Tax=Ischnura elegans TaxID=197161 RepID=UPI001ED89F50|nr:uncharacterized protein LOC124166836 [Ischnura elegans]